MAEVQLYGFSMDEIDEIAAEVFTSLAEERVPVKLSILALCRAITMLGTEEDMDMACLMIDRIRELTDEAGEYTEGELLEEVEEDDGEF